MSRKRVKGPSASGMSSSAASSPAVVHHPDFALDDYLAPYEGITKIRRLIYVAQRTVNTELYMEVMSMAKATLGEGALGPGYEMDDEWLKRSNRYFNDNLARLEGELNTRVRESVKHRIRESYNAVASHLMLRGDCTSALAKYLECKDYSEEPAHNIEASLNAIKASILMGSMGHVKNQYDRTQQFGRVLEENPLWVAKMQASMGLYELKRGNFGTAADYFISTGYELHGNYTDVMTGRDVAAYAALCALCSFDRHRLRTKLIDNEDFSKMIDLFPEMRTICRAFYNCQYATCFKMLGDLEKDFLLDIYMAPHIRKIIATVRERAMIQYFRPFTSVRIPAMATAFNVPLEVLEADLVNLIGEKKIQARIDSANKILYAKNSDDRLAMFETGLQAGERFVRDSRSLLLSMSLLQHDFVVRHPKERLMMSEMSMEAMAEMMSKGV